MCSFAGLETSLVCKPAGDDNERKSKAKSESESEAAVVGVIRVVTRVVNIALGNELHNWCRNNRHNQNAADTCQRARCLCCILEVCNRVTFHGGNFNIRWWSHHDGEYHSRIGCRLVLETAA